MLQGIYSGIRITIGCMLLFSVGYMLTVLGIAQLSTGKGNGETVDINGRAQFTNIAQSFSENRYFWPRPSAVDYNAAGSGGSNKGPSNPAYLAQVEERIQLLLKSNPGIKREEIPSELVTASGAGLDPHISVAAAELQVGRIAADRKLDENTIRELITAHTEQPLLDLFGPAKINVLQLNIALDQLENTTR